MVLLCRKLSSEYLYSILIKIFSLRGLQVGNSIVRDVTFAEIALMFRDIISVIQQFTIMSMTVRNKIGQKLVPLCQCLVAVLPQFASIEWISGTLFLDIHVHFTMELPRCYCIELPLIVITKKLISK